MPDPSETCAKGHRLDVCGVFEWEERGTNRNGVPYVRKYRICRSCKREHARKTLIRRRRREGREPAIRSQINQTQRILQLYDLKERQSTHWDREAIQKQIDAIVGTHTTDGASET